MRILIVADSMMAAEVIRRELRHSSCQVIGFVGGRDICAMTVARHRPDVIVVDDGLAATPRSATCAPSARPRRPPRSSC